MRPERLREREEDTAGEREEGKGEGKEVSLNGFNAREQTRSVALSSNWEIKKTQMGYSQSKMRRRQQRALEDQSAMSDFEKLYQTNHNTDIYDSEADDEAEELEHNIDKEKRSQVKWKAECRKATEAHDKRTIVSRQERTEKFL